MPDLPNLTTTEPDVVIDGKQIYFVWRPPVVASATRHPDGTLSAVLTGQPTIPRGALIEHRNRRDEPCIAWLPWIYCDDSPNDPHWTLVSLHPFSVAEPFVCTNCGMWGGIRNGRWWAALA